MDQTIESVFWDNEQNSVQNLNKIKGNLDLVKVVFPKVWLTIFRKWVSLESLLNPVKNYKKSQLFRK